MGCHLEEKSRTFTCFQQLNLNTKMFPTQAKPNQHHLWIIFHLGEVTQAATKSSYAVRDELSDGATALLGHQVLISYLLLAYDPKIQHCC